MIQIKGLGEIRRRNGEPTGGPAWLFDPKLERAVVMTSNIENSLIQIVLRNGLQQRCG